MLQPSPRLRYRLWTLPASQLVDSQYGGGDKAASSIRDTDTDRAEREYSVVIHTEQPSKHLWQPTLVWTFTLEQCFPTFSTSRYPWPRSSYLTVLLEENTYFLKIIISNVTEKVGYCCWVSIYALINVILFLFYFYISRYPRVQRNPGWESLP
jgi:hypothetical protein